MDDLFAVDHLAVRLRFVTPAQRAECAQAVMEATSAGRDAPAVEAVLVERGYLKHEDLPQLQSLCERYRAAMRASGYEMLEAIGSGSMGVVYRARQTRMDRIVAVKVLDETLAGDAQFVARFEREARAAATLQHENLIAGIDVGEASGLHYFVMEYVEGRTLGAHVRDQGRLDEAVALKVAYQIARALDHAHRHGCVHRDIKPDNIMLRHDGVAKLCDLGLVKRAAFDNALTATGNAVGTPYYLSPEMACGLRDIDIRSDLYSLGATLFHALCARAPFVASSPALVMTKHIHEPAPDPRLLNPSLSDGVVTLLERLLAKKPEERYDSPADLLAAIENLWEGKPLVSLHERRARLSQQELTPRQRLDGNTRALDSTVALETPATSNRSSPSGLPSSRPANVSQAPPGAAKARYRAQGALIGLLIALPLLAWALWSDGPRPAFSANRESKAENRREAAATRRARPPTSPGYPEPRAEVSELGVDPRSPAPIPEAAAPDPGTPALDTATTGDQALSAEEVARLKRLLTLLEGGKPGALDSGPRTRDEDADTPPVQAGHSPGSEGTSSAPRAENHRTTTPGRPLPVEASSLDAEAPVTALNPPEETTLAPGLDESLNLVRDLLSRVSKTPPEHAPSLAFDRLLTPPVAPDTAHVEAPAPARHASITLDELSARLELSAAQREQVAHEIDLGKTRSMLHLNAPGRDGRNMFQKALHLLVRDPDAFRTLDTPEKVRQHLGRDDEEYFAQLALIESETRANVHQVLNRPQRALFDKHVADAVAVITQWSPLEGIFGGDARADRGVAAGQPDPEGSPAPNHE